MIAECVSYFSLRTPCGRRSQPTQPCSDLPRRTTTNTDGSRPPCKSLAFPAGAIHTPRVPDSSFRHPQSLSRRSADSETESLLLLSSDRQGPTRSLPLPLDVGCQTSRGPKVLIPSPHTFRISVYLGR